MWFSTDIGFEIDLGCVFAWIFRPWGCFWELLVAAGLTQAIIQPVDHLLLDKLKVFCLFPILSCTLRGEFEGDVDFKLFLFTMALAARPGGI